MDKYLNQVEIVQRLGKTDIFHEICSQLNTSVKEELCNLDSTLASEYEAVPTKDLVKGHVDSESRNWRFQDFLNLPKSKELPETVLHTAEAADDDPKKEEPLEYEKSESADSIPSENTE